MHELWSGCGSPHKAALEPQVYLCLNYSLFVFQINKKFLIFKLVTLCVWEVSQFNCY